MEDLVFRLLSFEVTSLTCRGTCSDKFSTSLASCPHRSHSSTKEAKNGKLMTLVPLFGSTIFLNVSLNRLFWVPLSVLPLPKNGTKPSDFPLPSLSFLVTIRAQFCDPASIPRATVQNSNIRVFVVVFFQIVSYGEIFIAFFAISFWIKFNMWLFSQNNSEAFFNYHASRSSPLRSVLTDAAAFSLTITMWSESLPSYIT